jgi:hypothetical protein
MGGHRAGRIFLVAFLLIVLVGGILSVLVLLQRQRLEGLKEAIAALEEERMPLRFMILERDQKELALRLRFYDLDGREVGVLERRLEGHSLFLDFAVLKHGDSFIAFPASLFSDEVAAAQGVSLYDAYDQAGFPAIFGSAGMKAADRRALAELFASVKSGDLGKAGFGSALHDVAEIGRFRVGQVYKVIARAKGGLEVMED